MSLASGHLDALVATIEGRDPPLFDEDAGEALASAEWREQWRSQLRQIADLDLAAREDIRRALDDIPAPEEWGRSDPT